MALDPEIAAMFAARAGAGGTPYWELPPEEARATVAGFPRPPRPEGLDVADHTIPGPGGDLTVRVYRATPTPVTAPAVLFFHGGGWVICDLDTHDQQVARLAIDSGCTWISVDYRRAPEAPFPAPLDDCIAATRWVAEHAGELGLAPTRLAVAGDSAGGNMAAVAALVVRDEGGPSIDLQVLIYPVLDVRRDTPSYQENGGYGLSRDTMGWFLGHYLGNPDTVDDWRAAPLQAPDLGGLPPAIVVAADLDVLRDEAVAYSERLRAAGVAVDLTVVPGVPHGFWAMPATVAAESIATTARLVAKHLLEGDHA